MGSIQQAIEKLHKVYGVAHIVITSIRDPATPAVISVVGSTMRSDQTPRFFRIDVPAIDCYFSGTGDMFAALIVVRLREAIAQAGATGIRSWVSGDHVASTDLPLAKATERVLASMQAVLQKTKIARDHELERQSGPQGELDGESLGQKRMILRRAKAAEVRIVRCLDDLRRRDATWKATSLEKSRVRAEE